MAKPASRRALELGDDVEEWRDFAVLSSLEGYLVCGMGVEETVEYVAEEAADAGHNFSIARVREVATHRAAGSFAEADRAFLFGSHHTDLVVADTRGADRPDDEPDEPENFEFVQRHHGLLHLQAIARAACPFVPVSLYIAALLGAATVGVVARQDCTYGELAEERLDSLGMPVPVHELELRLGSSIVAADEQVGSAVCDGLTLRVNVPHHARGGAPDQLLADTSPETALAIVLEEVMTLLNHVDIGNIEVLGVRDRLEFVLSPVAQRLQAAAGTLRPRDELLETLRDRVTENASAGWFDEMWNGVENLGHDMNWLSSFLVTVRAQPRSSETDLAKGRRRPVRTHSCSATRFGSAREPEEQIQGSVEAAPLGKQWGPVV